MAADSKTQAQVLAMQSTISQISSKVATIYTNLSAPYSTADIDGSLAQTIAGFNSQLTDILNKFTALQINISAG
jgi:hypothetical protein